MGDDNTLISPLAFVAIVSMRLTKANDGVLNLSGSENDLDIRPVSWKGLVVGCWS